jgi:ParB family chromosome partitioning protein
MAIKEANTMTKRKFDFTLPTNSLDELFSSQEERDDAKLERVRDIPLNELHPFKDHPFKIQSDEEMKRLIESIQKFGTLTPALARPLPEGGYELISGHRRLAACQVLGIETMPVIIREMSDDEAVIAMVDANLQREHILPSEKAFAYKMKLDAIKHQGKASVQVAEKLLSVEKVADDAGESKDQVRRYIRLTYLIPELLEMVDENKIAFNPAVEISYLEQSEQRVLLNAMELNDCTPSHAQSIRLKKLSQDGVLNDQTIYDILAEQKPNQQEQYKFKREDIRKYFPKSYTDKQVCDTVIKLLEQWQRRRERDRDSR